VTAEPAAADAAQAPVQLADASAFEHFVDRTIRAEGAAGAAVTVAQAHVHDLRPACDRLETALSERLLASVADRLRSVAGPLGDVAWLGGEDFAVLFTRGPEVRPAVLGQRVADVLEAPFTIGAVELALDVSVGVAQFPADAESGHQLVRQADAAMYTAKAAGGGVYADDHHLVDPLQPLTLAARLHRAIDGDELLLHYQPIFRLEDGRMMGVEALVRWQHPERGLVPPDEFIPVAERSGVIDALGDWVLDAACAQARHWQSLGFAPNFGINVSPRQLRRPDFVQRASDAVRRHGLPPGRFILELTETSWSAEGSALLPVLDALRSCGFALAIDDFGAGHSSLWRLRELPVQVIKVDRSFLGDVPDDLKATAIFGAVLDLAATCGCDVVAEGIEDDRQLDFLRRHGCALGQGFHLGRPVGAADIEALLHEALVDQRRSAPRAPGQAPQVRPGQ
jgi:diguanylate cyclase (GGDEF)-like protein